MPLQLIIAGNKRLPQSIRGLDHIMVPVPVNPIEITLRMTVTRYLRKTRDESFRE